MRKKGKGPWALPKSHTLLGSMSPKWQKCALKYFWSHCGHSLAAAKTNSNGDYLLAYSIHPFTIVFVVLFIIIMRAKDYSAQSCNSGGRWVDFGHSHLTRSSVVYRGLQIIKYDEKDRPCWKSFCETFFSFAWSTKRKSPRYWIDFGSPAHWQRVTRLFTQNSPYSCCRPRPLTDCKASS